MGVLRRSHYSIAAMAALILLVACQVVAPSPACEIVRGQFAAQTYDGSPVTAELLDETVALIQQRLQRAGFVGGNATAEAPATIAIDLQAPVAADAFNVLTERGAEVELIAEIESIDDIERGTRLSANLPPLVDGNDIASAAPSTDGAGNPAFELTLSEAGRAILAAWTQAHVGEQLAITLDRTVLAIPLVVEPIDDGRLVTSGSFTQQQVDEVVKAVAAGVMPLALNDVSFETITAPCPTG